MTNGTTSEKPTTSTPPTPLELARVRFEDELDTALDTLRGVAVILETQVDGEIEALHLMAEVLYSTADKLHDAFAVCKQVAAKGGEATVTPKVSEAAVKDPSVLISAAGSTEQPKRTDEEIGLYAVADAAHIDALSARAALGRLVSLIVQGELDPSVDTDMDALVLFADGIGARVAEVADALDRLAHHLRGKGE